MVTEEAKKEAAAAPLVAERGVRQQAVSGQQALRGTKRSILSTGIDGATHAEGLSLPTFIVVLHDVRY